MPVAPGIELETAVFLPERAGPHPAELLRTPYGIDDREGDAARMCADGVAVVVQSVRGRFGSTGDFDLGASDGTDGRATVEWVRRQPWSDGRVALWGFSYGGFTQWATLAAGAEGVVAACPSMCPPPGRTLDFRRGGAIEWAALCHWLPRQAAIGGGLDAPASAALLAAAFEPVQVEGADGDVDVDRALTHPTVGRHPQRAAWPDGASQLGELWQEVFHGLSADPDPLPPISTPCLIVGSWYDLWSAEPGEAFAAVRAASVSDEVAAAHRLVLAPAGHGFHPLQGVDLGPDVHRFGLDLDHQWALEWLTGTVGPLRSLAPVTWFLIGADEWRSSHRWPPEGAIQRTWAIGSGRHSDFVADPRSPVPTRGGSGMLLAPGPRDQTGLSGSDRGDVASFGVVDAPAHGGLVLAGPVVADLWVSVDVADLAFADADVAAKLVDVDPQGGCRSVCDGITRLRWRHGAGAPDLVRTRKPTAVRVHLGAVGYRLAPGHRLRLDVAGSNFPRYALNAHTGAAEGTDAEADLRCATIRVHHDDDHRSAVTLTVLPGDPS